jgi:hypothetical protein
VSTNANRCHCLVNACFDKRAQGEQCVSPRQLALDAQKKLLSIDKHSQVV